MRKDKFKKISVLSCLLLLLFPAFSQNEKISIAIKNQPLSAFFSAIEQQSSYRFSFNPDEFDFNTKIDFQCKNKTINQVLDSALLPLNLSYLVNGNQIIVRLKPFDKPKPQNFTISGYAINERSNEVLPGAYIFIDGKIKTISNELGFYSLTLAQGIYNFKVTYIGFLDTIFRVNVSKNLHLQFKMKTESQIIPKITINPDLKSFLRNNKLESFTFKGTEINRQASLAGVSDAMKSLFLVPGVNFFGDGSLIFNIRGADKSQNEILIDDTPIYNPSHMLGFFSAVEPMSVSSITLYKDDFPIEYTGSASAVVDIRIREGNYNRFNFSGSLNPILRSFIFEGPLKKQKASFMITYRGSQLNWLYNQDISFLKVNFYDFQTKFNFNINDNNKIFLSTFASNDDVQLTQDFLAKSMKWNNIAATLRWSHIFNQKLFTHTTFSYSNYNYYVYFTADTSTNWNSQVYRTSLKTDFTFYQSTKQTIKFGIAGIFYFLAPANIEDKAYLPSSNVFEAQVYAGDDLILGEKVRLKFGLVLKDWINAGPTVKYTYNNHVLVKSDSIGASIFHTEIAFEPRIALSFKLNENDVMKFAASQSVQFVQYLSSSISPFTSVETWIPADNNILPIKSLQFSAGFASNKDSRSFTSEIFFKRMQNISDFANVSTLLYNSFVFEDIRFGTGYAAGIEFSYVKQIKNFGFQVNYTYSRALQKVPDVNFDKMYLASFDKPHNLNITLNYSLKRLKISLLWVYSSGNRFSTPLGYIDFLGYTVPVYALRNNSKLPDYHRLDLYVNYMLNKKENAKFEHYLTFSVLNVYNHHNPVMLTFNKLQEPNGLYDVQSNFIYENQLNPSYIYIFNIVPLLTYTFKFK